MSATVVVTGANSYLGQLAVRYLNERTDMRVVAVCSPRFSADDQGDGSHTADLTQPLSSSLQHEIEMADRVIHFAWVRGKRFDDILRQNRTMIDALLQPLASPDRFTLVSTVAADPQAVSTYGRSKYVTMNELAERGGTSVVCGLVVDLQPRGPFALLSKCVRSFPIAVRCPGGGPPVYPVHAQDIGPACETVARTRLEAGHYRLYSDAIRFNDFLRIIERLHPRARLPLPLPAGSIVKLTSLLRVLRLLPSSLADKVMTFLHKNEDYLASHRAIDGFAPTLIHDNMLRAVESTRPAVRA